jgi:hypothetical protein
MILKQHHHRKFITRSLVFQTILQFITFGSAILSYHYVLMPQLTRDAYQNGRIEAWNEVVNQKCFDLLKNAGG